MADPDLTDGRPGGAPTGPRLATVELVGAVAYAQLRSFATTAMAVRHTPDVRAADQVADFALREHVGYILLRDRLRELTDLPEPHLERQRHHIDAFFNHVPIVDWWSACTLFAVGLPMAADFARAVAPAVDGRTARVVVTALAERYAFEGYAIEQLSTLLADDPRLRERTRRLAAEITGMALTEFQGAVRDTDALLILLQQLEGTGDEDLLRRTAVSLLAQHRRRMAAIGVDSPD